MVLVFSLVAVVPQVDSNQGAREDSVSDPNPVVPPKALLGLLVGEVLWVRVYLPASVQALGPLAVVF